MNTWVALGAVALGGGTGAMLRYLLGLQITLWMGRDFPWSTLLINVTGSFLMGFMAQYLTARWPEIPLPRLLLLTGLLGGYTTYSAFSLETLQLLQNGHAARGGLYLALTLLVCLLAVTLGDTSGSKLFAGPDRWPEGQSMILYGLAMTFAGMLAGRLLMHLAETFYLGASAAFILSMMMLVILGLAAVIWFRFAGYHGGAKASLGQALEMGLGLAVLGLVMGRRLASIL